MQKEATIARLPHGWERADLTALGELHCGQSPSVSEVNVDGRGVPYVTGPEQWDGQRITENKWTEFPKRIAPEGSIFITVKGAGVGKMFRGIRAAIGRDIYAFKPFDAPDSDFLYYALRHTIDLVVLKAKGDIPGLSKAHILGHSIGVPGINEQRRIVAKIDELFSELDKGVDSLKMARDQLRVYRQVVLKNAFEGKLTSLWRHQRKATLKNSDQLLAQVREDCTNGYQKELSEWRAAVKKWNVAPKASAKPVKPSEPAVIEVVSTDERKTLPELPEGWIWVSLGAICDVSGGLTKNEKKRSTLQRKMKFLRVANVYADEVFVDDVHEIKVTDDEAAKVTLRPGDLLIVEGNGSIDQIGRVAMWAGEILECGHQNHLIRARLQVNSSPRFILQFLLSPLGRRLIVKQASSTTGLHTLSISKVSSLRVPMTTHSEEFEVLEQIDERLSKCDALLKEIEVQLARSNALRLGILKKAFSGHLVKQDTNDEPASVLLKRIRTERENIKEVSPNKTKRRNNAA